VLSIGRLATGQEGWLSDEERRGRRRDEALTAEAFGWGLLASSSLVIGAMVTARVPDSRCA